MATKLRNKFQIASFFTKNLQFGRNKLLSSSMSITSRQWAFRHWASSIPIIPSMTLPRKSSADRCRRRKRSEDRGCNYIKICVYRIIKPTLYSDKRRFIMSDYCIVDRMNLLLLPSIKTVLAIISESNLSTFIVTYKFFVTIVEQSLDNTLFFTMKNGFDSMATSNVLYLSTAEFVFLS